MQIKLDQMKFFRLKRRQSRFLKWVSIYQPFAFSDADLGRKPAQETLRKKKEEEEAMWAEYVEQRKKQRSKEEEELKKLKERQVSHRAGRPVPVDR